MPSLIDLRRRVRAVKNTQQITKAMKMVAASKLRRAQERISAARPLSESAGVQRGGWLDPESAIAFLTDSGSVCTSSTISD